METTKRRAKMCQKINFQYYWGNGIDESYAPAEWSDKEAVEWLMSKQYLEWRE